MCSFQNNFKKRQKKHFSSRKETDRLLCKVTPSAILFYLNFCLTSTCYYISQVSHALCVLLPTSSFFKCWFMCRKRYTHCFCLCMLFIHKILHLLMLYGTKQPFLCLHNTIRLLCIGSFKMYLHFLTA